MRLTRALLIYFVVVFVGGAIIAPVLYQLARGMLYVRGFGGLANVPFHRIVDRAVLGMALICLWPLVRVMGITSWRELGLVNPGEKWRDIVPGFLIGFCSLAVIAFLAIATGVRKGHLTTSSSEIVTHLVSASLAAITVAFLEEILFRGALFGAMRKSWRLGTALVMSSVIYALAHFVQKAPDPELVKWSSGLAMLPSMFGKLGDVQALVPKGLVLLVAGMILAIAYHRSGSLFLPMGVHAGWIFWLKSYRFISTPAAGTANWFWGTDELINGWLALLVLVGVLVTVERMYPRRQLATSPVVK
ncbi:MAG: CPBP family intramembrane glutamic endopeptidase [Limisphaerales bacterium]